MSVSRWVMLGLVSGLLAAGGSLRAGETGMKQKHVRMDPAQRVEMLTKKFNLTAEQQAQAKKMIEEKRQKIDEISKSYHDQFRAILSDEQKKKWDGAKSKDLDGTDAAAQ